MGIKPWLASAVIATCVMSGTASRAEFPERTVELVNPFQAGSGVDLMLRVLAEGLSAYFKRPFVVTNRTGAGGAIAVAYVAHSTPDGHTLLHAPALVRSVLPIIQGGVGYDPESIVPICQTFENEMSLVVPSSSSYTSVRQLVEAARARPDTVTFAATPAGTITHLAVAALADAAQVRFNHASFRGDSELMSQLMGGHVDFASVTLASAEAAGPSIRVLALFAEQRNPSLPDVPTVKEQGYDVAPTSFGGLFAPAEVPSATIAKLANACKFAVEQQAYADLAARLLQGSNYFADTSVFAARLAADIDEKAGLLRRLGLPN